MHEVDAFQELVGEQLSGVTFLKDYIQLQFNPLPVLNAYNPVTVHCFGREATFGQDTFANLILDQLDKPVRSVVLQPDQALTITLGDSTRIVVSLLAEDYVGPEAINLFGKNDRMVVI